MPDASSRSVFRLARRRLVLLLLVVVVVAAQLFPHSARWALVGVVFVADTLVCGLGFCEPEVPDGMVLVEVTEDLGTAPVVAIDVDRTGRVYAAHSGRLDNGVLDNRDFSESELDEELALDTVEDRAAMIERFIERGKNTPEDFTAAEDRVVIFEDVDGDGRLESRTPVATTAEALAGIAAGVLVEGDRIYWTAVPDVWLLRDDDGDGLPETREALSTGWGVRWAFGGHDLHGLVRGPDGWIYFSMGDRGFSVPLPDGRRLRPSMDVGRGAVLRMRPDGSELEIFAEGLRNPQELAFDDLGNLFTVDNNSDSIDQARIVYVVEGGDSGWMMPYQLLRDPAYERGPWNAEKLWSPRHEGQPAYVNPPLRFFGRGPSGVAYAPGLGLPERYRNHFFVADYLYWQPMSGVRTFRVQPEGAGFRATEPEWFVGNVLATDVAFGLDGSTYISHYKHLPPRRGGIARLRMDEATAAAQNERIAEMRALLAGDLERRSTSELVGLLGFEDRRVRMPAQQELVRRGAVDALHAAARDRSATRLARVHAVWALGQLGAPALARAGWLDLEWLDDEDAEVRAQVVRMIGDARATALSSDVQRFLRDPSLRVRAFAAGALGRLGDASAVSALGEMLRENADRDVYLRHAGALALFRLASLADLRRLAADPSASVRMGALLAFRRAEAADLARFLSDEDPRLVVEAARAIHDLDVAEARLALAALAGTALPYADDDPQTTYALHRRVVNANLREGTAEAAHRLGAHAADARNPMAMRRLALQALADFVAPPPRDAVLGTWEPIPERPTKVVHEAIDAFVPALIGTELEAPAVAMAAAYGRVPLGDEALVQRVKDERGEPALRVASLEALSNRAEALAPGTLDRVVDAGLRSGEPLLRAEARDVLASLAPDRALDAIDAIEDRAPRVERQRAVSTLGAMAASGNGDAESRLREWSSELPAGALPKDVRLDVLEAVRGLSGPAFEPARASWDAAHDPDQPLARRTLVVEGGDPLQGERVFNGNGDCKRCHAVDGQGGETGPALTGLGRRMDAETIVEAVLVPEATIAVGFEQEEGGSAMPPVGRELPLRELRDLVAYLKSLR